MSETETGGIYRVRVETPDATFDGTVNNPAEWDALVTFLEYKLRHPLETEQIQERDSDMDTKQ